MDMVPIPRGQTVASFDGGATFKTLGEFPYVGDLSYIDPVTGLVGGGNGTASQEGVTYFRGGCIYTITTAQATALTASGYGAYIT